jgi:hypothetical protein
VIVVRRRYYYQVGVVDYIIDQGREYRWVDGVFTQRRKAEAEALRFARERGGIPVVRYWDQALGEFPAGPIRTHIVSES